MNDRTAPLAPGPEQDNCADDRQNEAGWMKCGARCRFRKEACDQAAQDGAADAEKCGSDEAEMLHTGHNGARNPPNDETDDYRPNNV